MLGQVMDAIWGSNCRSSLTGHYLFACLIAVQLFDPLETQCFASDKLAGLAATATADAPERNPRTAFDARNLTRAPQIINYGTVITERLFRRPRIMILLCRMLYHVTMAGPTGIDLRRMQC